MLLIIYQIFHSYLLFDYVFSYDLDHHAIVLGNAMIYNHQNDNNITYKYNDKRTKLVFIAKKDIKKGEELFDNYGTSWFEKRNKVYRGK